MCLMHGEIINNRYSFSAVAQDGLFWVKNGKKKPNAEHSVEIGVNRHS